MTKCIQFASVVIFLITVMEPAATGASEISRRSSDNVLLRRKRNICADAWPSRCPGYKNYCYLYKNYCRKTCRLCTVTPNMNAGCMDKHQSCLVYKNSGYCLSQSRYNTWMRANCAARCGFCTKKCADVSTSCPAWATNGECYKNPRYMLTSCKKSCGKCPKIAATKKPTPKAKTTAPMPMKSCGVPKAPDGRIVGGHQAIPGAWPWHVAISKCRNCSTLPFCAGTLINNEWVVTAAHCTDGWLASELYIILGDSNLRTWSGREIIVGVQAIYIHGQYSINVQFDYDISLLRLKNPVQFTDYIKPACLPQSLPKFPAGTSCTVTGFGRTSENGKKTPRLMQAAVPLIAAANCKKVLGQSKISSSMLCAGYASGKIDACKGDSGGPLVCKSSDGSWQLIGVVSWGNGCARKNQYGVYSDVQVLKGWITNTMSGNAGSG